MSKSKTTKYKITDTNIDKEIIGKQVTVEKIKSKGGQTKKSRTKAPTWFNDFINNRFSKLEKEVLNLGNRLDRIVKVNNLKE